MKTLYGNSLIAKILMLVFAFPRRLFHVFSAFKYDFVFIHRELAPIGPPVFEWLLKFIIRKPFIYDFDDAIWLSNVSDVNKKFDFLKAYWKVPKIIKWSDKVTVGNKYPYKYLVESIKKYPSPHNISELILEAGFSTARFHKILPGVVTVHTAAR